MGHGLGAVQILAALAQGILRAFAPRDILDNTGEPATSRGESDDVHMASRRLRERLEIRGCLGGHHVGEAREILIQHAREHLTNTSSNDLLRRNTRMAGVRVVHLQDAPVDGPPLLIIDQLVESEAVRHVLEQQTVLLLTFAQQQFLFEVRRAAA